MKQDSNRKENLLSRFISLQSEISELHENTPRCNCQNSLEVRLRTIGDGQHYVYQCQICGEQRGNPIKKNDALKISSSNPISGYNKSLEISWQAKRSEHIKVIQDLEKKAREIDEELNGPSEWSLHTKTRAEAETAVNENLNFLINRIGKEQAIQIIERRLSTLKQSIVLERRKSSDRFKTEDELKIWFENHLKDDFYIRQEVSGVHLAERVGVRIDFLLKARPHLIDAGFDSAIFGVEIKYFPPEHDFTSKISRGIWQTITYIDCEFQTKEGPIKPKYCLIFSNLSFQGEMALLNDFYSENDRLEWSAMLRVANHARVGILRINGNKGNFLGWSIYFAGGVYFSCHAGDMENKFRKSNANTINKKRIGNF